MEPATKTSYVHSNQFYTINNISKSMWTYNYKENLFNLYNR